MLYLMQSFKMFIIDYIEIMNKMNKNVTLV